MARSSPTRSHKTPPPEVAFLLSQVGAHVAGKFAERIAFLGLKPYHAGILRVLADQPGLTQQALCDLLGMFPSRLVGLLDELGAEKLIERRKSPADRRTYALHLTKAGRDAVTKILKAAGQLQDDLCAALSATERKQLGAFLTRIVAQQQITPGIHPSYRKLGEACGPQ